MDEPEDEPKKKGSAAKGVLGCTCLTTLVCLSGILGVMFAIIGGMKSTDVYTGALKQVREDTEVAEALGTPISDGLFVAGHISVTHIGGNANLWVPVSGPKGDGKLNIVAERSLEHVWTYSILQVELTGGKTINLLAVEKEDRD